MSKRSAYLIVASSLLLLYLLNSPGYIVLVPGISFLFVVKRGYRLLDAIAIVLNSSVAFWTVSFYLLGVIGIGLSWGHSVAVLFTIAVLIYYALRSSAASSWLDKPNRWQIIQLIILVFIIYILFLPLSTALTLPGDLSMNAYLARLIVEHDGAFDSFEPIWNLDKPCGYPMGLHSLAALLTMASDGVVPIYRSAAYATVLGYIFLIVNLSLLLCLMVPGIWAMVISVTVLFAAGHPLAFVRYGAHGNIFAYALALYAIHWLYSFRLSGRGLCNHVMIGSLMISSVPLMHTQPAVLMLYLSFLLVPVYLVVHRYFGVMRAALVGGLLLLISAILLSPYLAIADLKVSDIEMLEVVKWHQDHGLLLHEGFLENLKGLVEYLRSFLSPSILILGLIGLIAGIFFHRKCAVVGLVLSFLVLLLLINSSYWLLPLSFSLLPDRLLVALVIAIAILCCGFYALFSGLCQGLPKAIKIPLIALLCLLLFAYSFIGYKRDYYELIQRYTVLTPPDLKAMEWIAENTHPGDLFINNIYDAGLWIPAMAMRPITEPATNIIFYQDLLDSMIGQEPRYLYIGAKIINQHRVYTDKVVSRYPVDPFTNPPICHRLVYRNNGVSIYRLGPCAEVLEDKETLDINDIQLTVLAPLDNAFLAPGLEFTWEATNLNFFNLQFSYHPSFSASTIIFETYPFDEVRLGRYKLPPLGLGSFKGRDIGGELAIYWRVLGVGLADGAPISPAISSQPGILRIR